MPTPEPIDITGGLQAPPKQVSLMFPYAFQDNVLGAEMPSLGTKSIFNEYAMFRYHTAAGDYNQLYDRQGQTGITSTESRNPSAANIIKWFQENSDVPTPYSYADFLYCKYYAKIPNNYMVTLRRYPIPMLDNLKTPDERRIPPISQAVTWLGEEPGNKLSELMKFACGLNWKEIEAAVQNVTGNEKGFESGPLGAAPGGNILAGIQGFLNPKEYSGLAKTETDYAKEVYGSEGPYANKVYGPVNSINKTKARDMGLHFDQDITLNFHYELKSISTINPKAAMLDILANMLTLTYNNAKFWGGAIRYFPQHPNVPFFGDQNKFYSGDVGGYIDSVVGSFKDLGTEFTKVFSTLMSGNIIDAIKQLAGGGGSFLAGKIAAKDRPQILAIRSLLTGAPIGEWHLVVGNPMNPIAMIGNLICEDMEVEFGDKLGADDFPTEIKFTVKLKHGKPRDSGDIQSMFNLGNGRLYYGINDDAVFSSTHNSVVDTSGTKGEVTNNTALGKKGFTTGDGSEAQLTAEQIADQKSLNAAESLVGSGASMWGSKFEAFELQISKKWAGSGVKTEKSK